MNRLNKDEIKVLVEYMDHDTMRAFATVCLNNGYPKQAVEILNCAMDQLLQERMEIAKGLNELSVRLEDIEHLSEQINELASSDEEEESSEDE